MAKVTHPHTNESIEKLFSTYNRKYFGGTLRVLHVKFAKLPDGIIGNTKSYRRMFGKAHDVYGILLDNSLKKTNALMCGTLLHEMVHVELNLAGIAHECGDGRSVKHQRFNHRMLQLAEVGALNGIW